MSLREIQEVEALLERTGVLNDMPNTNSQYYLKHLEI